MSEPDGGPAPILAEADLRAAVERLPFPLAAGGGATLAARGVVGAGCVHAPQARIILAAAIASGAHPQTLF